MSTINAVLLSFIALVPLVLYLFYFLDLQLTAGIVWTIHLWLGSCTLAGVVGFLLSYLTVGPRIEVDKHSLVDVSSEQ